MNSAATVSSADNSQTTTATSVSGQWYAVYTRARHEKAVERHLQTKGIESFVPLREVLSQWKDRRKWVKKPLFPGYLFVHILPGQLPRVSFTRGVVYVVGSESGPVPVPEEQVDAVRHMIEKRVPVDPWPYMQEGKRVRVMSGPLIGMEGFIVTRKKKSRLVVSVDLLGRSVAAEIDAQAVEVI